MHMYSRDRSAKPTLIEPFGAHYVSGCDTIGGGYYGFLAVGASTPAHL